MSIQGQCHLHIIFKTQFSQKPLRQILFVLSLGSQTLFVLSLGRGTKVCIKWSRSHDQDSRHAHICVKIF